MTLINKKDDQEKTPRGASSKSIGFYVKSGEKKSEV